MTTTAIPEYIASTGIMEMPSTHSWDDADPGLVYLREDKKLRHELRDMSDRALLAVAAGFAEWIAVRFAKQTSDRMLFEKIEAVRAGIADWRYMSHARTPPSQAWQGPIRGPMWAAADVLDQIVDLVQRKQFASPETVCMAFLVVHVMPEPKSFVDWRRAAITRLRKLYPLDRDQPLGTAVPPQALDPSCSFQPGTEASLMQKYLEALDWAANPFLSSPDDMRNAGFAGDPYTS